MGVVGITNVLRMAECSSVSSLADGNLHVTEVYLVINDKLKTDLQCCMVGKVLRLVGMKPVSLINVWNHNF